MIPEALEKIADHVLSLDDSDLAALLTHYKDRMSHDEPTRSWERAVIAYFLLNGIRVKNAMKRGKEKRLVPLAEKSARLRLVKV